MRKNFHFAEHIYSIIISLLLSVTLSFYGTLLLGTFHVLVCAITSTQIFLGVLVYRYLHWGYELSVRERSSLREFLVGMLPAQFIHFIFYIALYGAFIFLCNRRIFESLPIYRWVANTPVLGFSFVLTGTEVLYFTEDEEKMPKINLPDQLFWHVLAVFFVLAVIGMVVAYFCYRRGVYLNDRERREMVQGVQRKKRAPFARRYRFVPILNILPLFSFLRRHFFVSEYKMYPAALLLIFLFVARLLYNGICVWLCSFFPNFYFYYSLKIIGVYLLGIIISSIELRDKK